MERPHDRAMFDDWVSFLIYRSRPGLMYRVPFWASPTRRRQTRRYWEETVRDHMGRMYELGRQ